MADATDQPDEAADSQPIEDEETAAKMEKLIDMLEENDDVQAVWHNWDMPEE